MNYATAPVIKRKAALNADRLRLFGPPPINVFKQLRQSLDLSHEQLGLRMLLTKQALIRLEQGTFATPLPTALDWWVSNHGYSHLQLTDAYEGYQEAQRLRHHRLFSDLNASSAKGAKHPLRQLRDASDLTTSELSKSLCLPQATLNHFERKWRTQKTVPKCFTSVLRQTGYTNNEVFAFCRAYEIWRANNK